MLADEEKRYLFWLGASVWSGEGAVVEIGPWLGGSTVCLAAGMRASGHDARAKLHAVDNFMWREFMAARAPLPIRPGDSFEPFFLKNVAAFSDMVVSQARALPDEVVEGDREATAKRFAEERAVPVFDGIPGRDPIEILFIDGAKSWRGMRHLLLTLRDRLIENKTLLVCQDYKYWGTYWVPMMMARLARHVEPVHNVLGGTTVAFRLTSAIPREELEQLEDHVDRISEDEGRALISCSVALLQEDGDALGTANVSLARVSFLSHQGKVDAAVRELSAIQTRWPLLRDVSQVLRARDYLQNEKQRGVSHPLRIRMNHQWEKLRRALGKRAGDG